MVKFQQTIEINRPMVEVFEFLNTPANYLLWQSSVSGIEATNEMNPGSIITFTNHGLGRTLKLSGLIRENNGRDLIVGVSHSGPVRFTSRYHLKPIGTSSTSLTLDNDIEVGSLFKLAQPVLQHLAEVRYAADLKALKAILESN